MSIQELCENMLDMTETSDEEYLRRCKEELKYPPCTTLFGWMCGGARKGGFVNSTKFLVDYALGQHFFKETNIWHSVCVTCLYADLPELLADLLNYANNVRDWRIATSVFTPRQAMMLACGAGKMACVQYFSRTMVWETSLSVLVPVAIRHGREECAMYLVEHDTEDPSIHETAIHAAIQAKNVSLTEKIFDVAPDHLFSDKSIHSILCTAISLDFPPIVRILEHYYPAYVKWKDDMLERAILLRSMFFMRHALELGADRTRLPAETFDGITHVSSVQNMEDIIFMKSNFVVSDEILASVRVFGGAAAVVQEAGSADVMAYYLRHNDWSAQRLGLLLPFCRRPDVLDVILDAYLTSNPGGLNVDDDSIHQLVTTEHFNADMLRVLLNKGLEVTRDVIHTFVHSFPCTKLLLEHPSVTSELVADAFSYRTCRILPRGSIDPDVLVLAAEKGARMAEGVIMNIILSSSSCKRTFDNALMLGARLDHTMIATVEQEKELLLIAEAHQRTDPAEAQRFLDMCLRRAGGGEYHPIYPRGIHIYVRAGARLSCIGPLDPLLFPSDTIHMLVSRGYREYTRWDPPVISKFSLSIYRQVLLRKFITRAVKETVYAPWGRHTTEHLELWHEHGDTDYTEEQRLALRNRRNGIVERILLAMRSEGGEGGRCGSEESLPLEVELPDGSGTRLLAESPDQRLTITQHLYRLPTTYLLSYLARLTSG